MKLTILICAIFMLLTPLAAQETCAITEETPMTVTVDWLAGHLDHKNLVLLHVGVKDEYDAGHIPGALFVNTQDLSAPPEENGDLSLQLPSVEKAKAAFEKMGIGNDSRIIIYFGKDWVSPATRVYYTFDYFGLGKNTSILQGGMPAWTTAGKTLSKDVPAVKPGSVKLTANDNILAKAQWLKANLNKDNVKIIDSRTANFTTARTPEICRAPGTFPERKIFPLIAWPMKKIR
ncbi:MAG TPA: rhodanese-like domain-containing protein [Pyrinomonadaceae bacterium]|jgi:thiosulfate/3-mercaptopyruvate sulfurtransferase|nr:rhodanese-like domain-containing protein [Pyrinomonadaceae bacterium]